MGEIHKISCPSCNTILAVGYFAGIESRSFSCPKCHKVHKFTEYARTQRSEANAQARISGNQIGFLQLPNGETALLKEGRNVIGRRSSRSTADIQIPDGTHTMSREHFYIDVSTQDGKVSHILSVNPAARNSTRLDGIALNATDRKELREGQQINAGSVSLVFSIPRK